MNLHIRGKLHQTIYPHQFNGRELGRIPGDGEGQGGLACCNKHTETNVGKNGEI